MKLSDADVVNEMKWKKMSSYNLYIELKSANFIDIIKKSHI